MSRSSPPATAFEDMEATSEKTSAATWSASDSEATKQSLLQIDEEIDNTEVTLEASASSEERPSSPVRKGVTLVVVLRHGQTDANVRDGSTTWKDSWGEPLLNSQGVQDAENARKIFESLVEVLPENFTYKVISSPSRRTVQTAAIALETTLLKTMDDIRRHACRSSALCEVPMTADINKISDEETTNYLFGDAEAVDFLRRQCGRMATYFPRDAPSFSPDRATRMRALNCTSDISKRWQAMAPNLEAQGARYWHAFSTAGFGEPLPPDPAFTDEPVVRPQGRLTISWRSGMGHADVRGTEVRQLVSDLCVDLVVLVTHNRLAEFVDWEDQMLPTGGAHIFIAHPLEHPAEPWNFCGVRLEDEARKQSIRQYFQENRNPHLVSKYPLDWPETENRKHYPFVRLETRNKAAQRSALPGLKPSVVPAKKNRIKIVIYIAAPHTWTWRTTRDPSYTTLQYESKEDLSKFEEAKASLAQVDLSSPHDDSPPGSKLKVQVLIDSDARSAQAAVFALEENVLAKAEDVASRVMRLPLSEKRPSASRPVSMEDAAPEPEPEEMRVWLTPARQELLEAMERLQLADLPVLEEEEEGDGYFQWAAQAAALLHQSIINSDADVVFVVMPTDFFHWVELPLYHDGVWTVLCKKFDSIAPPWTYFNFYEPFKCDAIKPRSKALWRILEEFHPGKQ